MTLRQLIYQDCTKLTPQNLDQYKRVWSQKLGTTPKNSHILRVYKTLVATGKIHSNSQLENILKTRAVRSLSGVTPFAVMTKPFTCPGRCTFCPQDLNMPKSYLSDEPAGQRAQAVNFDPYLQIKNRLSQLTVTGHDTGKVELIVIGGTFSAYPDTYKVEFFKRMFDAVNDSDSDSLENAQKRNETAKHRIVSLSAETRPDWVTEKEVRLFRRLGVTKIQLGVQAFDEAILKRIKRGHSLKPVAEATRLLRNAGFKICYHYMPNLPGSNPKKDVAMAKIMYTDPRFKPDFVKIYPCQVIPKTTLYHEWQRGEFKTYSDEVLKNVLKEIKLITPEWCRIDRLVRDISKTWVASGTKTTNMRQLIQEELKSEERACRCIRCREIKEHKADSKPQLKQQSINTLGGRELFLTFEKNDQLYSLLRLRLPNQTEKLLFPELKSAALIREIHTFGKVVPLDTKEKGKAQHHGLGKKLLTHAESIAQKVGYQKIAVISAIGTRNYYRKLGYTLEGYYMTKTLAAKKALYNI